MNSKNYFTCLKCKSNKNLQSVGKHKFLCDKCRSLISNTEIENFEFKFTHLHRAREQAQHERDKIC